LGQASLTLPDRKYYIEAWNNSAYNVYYETMVNTSIKMGASEETAKNEMKDVLEFETQLATISVPIEKQRDKSSQYNLFSKGELILKFKNVRIYNINHYLRLDQIIDSLSGNKIENDEIVNVAEPSFFEKLNELIPKTKKRTLANYIIWRFVLESLPHLSNNWKEIHFSLIGAISGNKVDTSRSEFCLQSVSEYLHIALSSLYIKSKLKKNRKIKREVRMEFKKTASKLVKELLITSKKEFSNIDWMEEETKQKALEKLNAFISLTAYPQQFLKTKKVENYFSEYKIVGEYYEDYFASQKFAVDKQSKKLRWKNKRNDWKEIPNVLNTNAYNEIGKNKFIILLGILQPGLFDGNSRNCMNVARIGSVISHEIFHSFDDEGRQYNKFGNLQNWWDNKTNATFFEKQECVIKQYSKYYVSDIDKYLNAINTQGENIADIAAAVLSYKTFKRLIKSGKCDLCEANKSKFNNDQLFWIYYAQTTSSNNFVKNILSDPHSPGEFRVVGPLSDNVDFSKSFNCGEATPMNPVNKCTNTGVL
ncbi:Membrane metallo-endopeptidase-like 1, partial [Leptotrombidium deliense]